MVGESKQGFCKEKEKRKTEVAKLGEIEPSR
jgi:hypothetical protein